MPFSGLLEQVLSLHYKVAIGGTLPHEMKGIFAVVSTAGTLRRASLHVVVGPRRRPIPSSKKQVKVRGGVNGPLLLALQVHLMRKVRREHLLSLDLVQMISQCKCTLPLNSRGKAKPIVVG